LAGAQIHDAVAGGQKPGVGIPSISGVGDRLFSPGEGDRRFDPLPALALDGPSCLGLSFSQVVDCSGALVPVPSTVLGQAKDVCVRVRSPPVAAPLKPSASPVVKPEQPGIEAAEEFSIAVLGPRKCERLLLPILDLYIGFRVCVRSAGADIVV